jgi:hypothetical protein
MSTVTPPRIADSRASSLFGLPSGERALIACSLRDEWLAWGVDTRPADRAAAEAAVCGLYRLVDEPPPRFIWTASPPAALAQIRDDPRFQYAAPLRGSTPALLRDWPLSARLASAVSELRQRLDARIKNPRQGVGGWRPGWSGVARTMTPQDALDAGLSAETVVDAAVFGSLRFSLRDAVCAPMRTAWLDGQPSGLAWYGQHEAHWIGHYDALRRAGLASYHSQDARQLDLWAQLARCTGWWWPAHGVCVMAERPVELRTEPMPGAVHGEVRLHHPDRPAVRYADGAELYVLAGTPVPEWVITGPTVDRIHAEPNIEVRRSAIERIGWSAYIEQAGLELVASAPDPGNAGSELHLYHVPRQVWGVPGRVLMVVNGSVEPDGRHRRYGLSVPSNLDDPVAAAGWSYGLTGAQYARLARRT